MNLFSGDNNMEIDEILGRIQGGNSINSSDTKYQYTPTSTERVMENPEQYIIPECIDCCKMLWAKGIDTYQCGNYDDAFEAGFWVEVDFDSLSDENKKKFHELENTDHRVYFSEGLQGQHTYRIKVDRVNNPNASAELCDIVKNLLLQDTIYFTTDEDLLDQYKRVGGEYKVDSKGNVFCEINPQRENATLYDALQAIENPELYIAKEGRLYHSQHALNVHKNYLEQIDKANSSVISNSIHM